MAHVIVSYDGTRNDRDALALGRLFATAGAEVSLAYVRHATESHPEKEAAVQEEAKHLLSVGAGQIGSAEVGQHVIFNASTADGLAELAAELGADVIAFGSGYRTPPGHVQVPQTAETLIEKGVSASIALAPAGLRREPVEHSIGTIGIEGQDGAVGATGESLAHALGAVLTDEEADLIIIPSQAGAPAGRLQLGSSGLRYLERAVSPVLLLAAEATLHFG